MKYFRPNILWNVSTLPATNEIVPEVSHGSYTCLDQFSTSRLSFGVAWKQVFFNWRWRSSDRTRLHFVSFCFYRHSMAPTPLSTGECPPLLQMAGQGAPWVEEQQTRNWPNCTDHHKSAHQTTNYTFSAKNWEAYDHNTIFRCFAPDRCPLHFHADRYPHFQIRLGATVDITY